METRDEIEQRLRARFEAHVGLMAERALFVSQHPIIPDGFFALASSECAETCVAGQFYSCISLCQSVAEGLAKFLAEKNNVPISDDHLALANRLQRDKVISAEAYASFREIRGNDRNDFHHLNSKVENDYWKLEQRAIACVNALNGIESEVFAYDVNEGVMSPKNRKYWEGADSGVAQVFIR